MGWTTAGENHTISLAQVSEKMHSKNSSTPSFALNFWVTLAGLVGCAISFFYYVHWEKEVSRAHVLRQQSYFLAEELRQSSTDLTSLARSYVVTGQSIYKQRFQEVLDIRDGKKPRPVDAYNVYWDLVLSDDKRPRPFGTAAPLLHLMKDIGFTEQEFAKIAEAKANSDALTKIEFAAMAVIESDHVSDADRIKAIEMLFSDDYQQAKANIMRPIAELNHIVDTRTKHAVEHAEAIALAVRFASVFCGVLLIVLLGRSYKSLHTILGTSVDELYDRIARIGKGDFTVTEQVARVNENSVSGWLTKTQENLARIEAERVRANRLKDQFVSTVSHELRTPLTAIRGAIGLVAGHYVEALPPDGKHMLELALRNSERLTLLINDLLDMEKIAAGKLEFNLQTQPLMPLVEQAMEMNSEFSAKFGVRYALKQRVDDATVYVDGQRLLQVLTNYLSNAAKFSPTGDQVDIAVRRLNTHVRIEVRDHGPGIPAEFRSHIFQKFCQADATNTRARGGTGLGLAITKELAERMGA